jgi:AcrR family transcriptional regulator
MPKPLTRAARKAETRTAILDAATRLFARRGIATTSLEQIADAVGLTKGAIYASFPSKRALVYAAAERQSIPMPFDRLTSPAEPLADRLANLGRWLATTQRGLSRELILFDMEHFIQTLRDPREGRISRERLKTGTEAIGQQLRANGESLPVEAGRFIALICAFGRGVLQYLALQPDAFTPDDVAQLFARLAGSSATTRPQSSRGRRKRAVRNPRGAPAPAVP